MCSFLCSLLLELPGKRSFYDFVKSGLNQEVRSLLFSFLWRLTLSVLRGHSVFLFSAQRPMASDFERFPSQILTHTLFVLILILEKEPVFPFKC